jgi:pantothenate synthetase
MHTLESFGLLNVSAPDKKVIGAQIVQELTVCQCLLAELVSRIVLIRMQVYYQELQVVLCLAQRLMKQNRHHVRPCLLYYYIIGDDGHDA